MEAVLEITDNRRCVPDAGCHEAKAIEPLEEVIDDIVATLATQGQIIERLKQGRCTTPNGLALWIFLNLERAADQCSNIGLLILGKSDKPL